MILSVVICYVNMTSCMPLVPVYRVEDKVDSVSTERVIVIYNIVDSIGKCTDYWIVSDLFIDCNRHITEGLLMQCNNKYYVSIVSSSQYLIDKDFSAVELAQKEYVDFCWGKRGRRIDTLLIVRKYYENGLVRHEYIGNMTSVSLYTILKQDTIVVGVGQLRLR